MCVFAVICVNILFDNLSLNIHRVVLQCINIIKGKTHTGVFDIFFLDGAINVQNSSTILSAKHPLITVCQGA